MTRAAGRGAMTWGGVADGWSGGLGVRRFASVEYAENAKENRSHVGADQQPKQPWLGFAMGGRRTALAADDTGIDLRRQQERQKDSRGGPEYLPKALGMGRAGTFFAVARHRLIEGHDDGAFLQFSVKALKTRNVMIPIEPNENGIQDI